MRIRIRNTEFKIIDIKIIQISILSGLKWILRSLCLLHIILISFCKLIRKLSKLRLQSLYLNSFSFYLFLLPHSRLYLF